jgi:hypothetical protein
MHCKILPLWILELMVPLLAAACTPQPAATLADPGAGLAPAASEAAEPVLPTAPAASALSPTVQPLAVRANPWEPGQPPVLQARLGRGYLVDLAADLVHRRAAVVFSWEVQLYDLDALQPSGSFHLPEQAASGAWSPGGRQLAVGLASGGAVLWDAESGRVLKYLDGSGKPLAALTWSPDGDRLAGGSRSGWTAWDVSSGAAVLVQLAAGETAW